MECVGGWRRARERAWEGGKSIIFPLFFFVVSLLWSFAVFINFELFSGAAATWCDAHSRKISLTLRIEMGKTLAWKSRRKLCSPSQSCWMLARREQFFVINSYTKKKLNYHHKTPSPSSSSPRSPIPTTWSDHDWAKRLWFDFKQCWSGWESLKNNFEASAGNPI